jgi:ribosome maturation factor RimP
MIWQGAIETTVSGLGYELVDAEKSAGGLLRVFIDHPAPAVTAGAEPVAAAAPRFITVDDCERVTRQLQHVLEVEGCDYQRLEVSSPGLDRPLKKAADYRRFVGEQAELTLRLPFKGRKKYRGELQAEGEGWRLLLEEGGGAEAGHRALDFTLDEVREAHLLPVVDFKGRPAAGAGKVGGARRNEARAGKKAQAGKEAPAGQKAQAGSEARAGNEVDGGRIQ